MIVSRTPFRISFVGGGSDLPSFYHKEPGAVVNAAINKFMYICVSPNFHKVWKVSYSRTEYANTVDEIQHPLVREALKLLNIDEPLDIVSVSDMPPGSGLGSSSTFTVGLLNALAAQTQRSYSPGTLAEMACKIEMSLSPIGKQDQYAAAYGGINYFQFCQDDTVDRRPIYFKPEELSELQSNLFLVHVGDGRDANQVLSSYNMESEAISDMAKMAMQLALSPSLQRLITLTRKGWIFKKLLSPQITNDRVEEIHRKAMITGCEFGKLLGAGADGFMLFYCPKHRQEAFREFNPIHIAIEPSGSRIVYDD
jgi:D-glycero-alpha-D-manno-heptose-7-phosphate kinase